MAERIVLRHFPSIREAERRLHALSEAAEQGGGEWHAQVLCDGLHAVADRIAADVKDGIPSINGVPL